MKTALEVLKRKAKQLDTSEPFWGNQKVTAAQAIGAMEEYANQPPVTEGEIKEEYNKLQSTVLQHNYIKELESYIEFIGLELDELAVLASACGWKSDRYKEGEKRRKKLTSIKNLLSKLSK